MNLKVQFSIENMAILCAIVATPILFKHFDVPTFITILVELPLFTAFMAKNGVSEQTAMRLLGTISNLLNLPSKKKDDLPETKKEHSEE